MISEEDFSENDDDEDENGIKKRKRKSTVQIKMLRQELDGEMNWTKEKICKMAEITGLSQSQVYKWCWDQKKKNQKYSHRDREIGSLKCGMNMPMRRKVIRKDYRKDVQGDEENEYYLTKPKMMRSNDSLD